MAVGGGLLSADISVGSDVTFSIGEPNAAAIALLGGGSTSFGLDLAGTMIDGGDTGVLLSDGSGPCDSATAAITLTGATLSCVDSGIVSTWTGGCPIDVTVTNSVLDADLALSLLPGDSLYMANSLATGSLQVPGLTDLEIINSILTAATGPILDFSPEPPACAGVTYSALWTDDGSSPAACTLPSSVQTTCDPGLSYLCPGATPADYLTSAACLANAGDPSPAWFDVDGSPNDLGPAGGPDSADFLGDLDLDGDGFPGAVDCDDDDPTVYPTAPEVCDGLDNDCDGLDGPDADADAWVDDACDGADCDDGDPTSYPGAPELGCDGIDQDCDGADPTDADADGYDALACAGGDDCDDADPAVSPGAAEACNGIDDDCDGSPEPDEVDDDGDGQMVCDGDCDDGDPANLVGNPEVCDGADNDCDGSPEPDEVDDDGDGVLVCDGDCDDGDPANFPGSPETCDGADNDCDGAVEDGGADLDGDGFTLCEATPDCDDGDATAFPGATELCDGVLNDCDDPSAPAIPTDEVDDDGDGWVACADWEGDAAIEGGDDCAPAAAATFPGAPELCDGLDNDCDGAPDADESDADGDGVPPCAGDCDGVSAETFPGAPELCDGLDNDCDGAPAADEADADDDGVRLCEEDCDDEDPDVAPGFDELCDDLDNDCDEALSPDEQDLDGDGFVPCDEPEPGAGLVGGDCDDARATVSPDAAFDFCDGNDSDCDGVLDPTEVDDDGDGYIDCGTFFDEEPADGVIGSDDCDPAEATVHPTAPELCDGLDNDCDGNLIQGEADTDGDGFLTCNPGEPDPATFDCDDASAEVFPGAPELCDGVDQDCDGDLIEDFGDADGDDLPDCDAAAVPAPGCDGGCSATGPTGPRHRGAVPDPVPAVALLLLPLARRRRRGRSR